MSGILEVVRIARPECPGGFCEINKTDLKESDILFSEDAREDPRKKVKAGRPAKKREE